MDPSTQQVDDLVKEFGAAINYSFDGTYNNRLVIDYSDITMGSGGRAPDRFPLKANRDSDVISSRTGLMYNTSSTSEIYDTPLQVLEDIMRAAFRIRGLIAIVGFLISLGLTAQ
ncbi:MAG: hypothetical protein U0231_21385 [Nitrospiraceae bacterium]